MNCIHERINIITLIQRTNRTVGDTLSTDCTVGFCNLLSAGYANAGTFSGIDHIPDSKSLYFLTNLNTTHTFDTLACITDQWEILRPFIYFIMFFKRNFPDIQFICHRLQTAISTFHTGSTMCIMLRQNKLNVHTAGMLRFITVCIDNHSFFYYGITGSYQCLFALYFYHTDTAGCDLIYLF